MIDAVVTDEFKMTELGPLLIEWDIIKSREKLLLNDSGVWGDDLNEGEIGIEVLRSTNMQNNQWVFEDIARRRITEEQFERYWLREGDILITKSSGSRRHIGKAAYVDEAIENRRCIFANFMQRLRFNDDVYPKFAFYFIISETGKNILLSRSTTTTGLRNLQKTDFENIIMPLPPLPKQKKIAYFLSTVQTAIEKTEAVIKATRELKKSLMKHLFTYGPVSIGEAENVPLKETEIGLVPEGWDVVKLGDVVRTQYGYTASACHDQVGPQFLRITDIDDDGNVNWSTVPYCMVSTDDYHRFSLEDGDTVVARIGATTGKSYFAVNSPRSVFASYLIRLKIKNKDKVYPAFISTFTKSVAYWTQVNQSKGEKLKSGLSARQLENILIPLPSFQIQQRSAIALSIIERKLETERNKKAALQALFKTLLSKLMTGKIRVAQLCCQSAKWDTF